MDSQYTSSRGNKKYLRYAGAQFHCCENSQPLNTMFENVLTKIRVQDIYNFGFLHSLLTNFTKTVREKTAFSSMKNAVNALACSRFSGEGDKQRPSCKEVVAGLIRTARRSISDGTIAQGTPRSMIAENGVRDRFCITHGVRDSNWLRGVSLFLCLRCEWNPEWVVSRCRCAARPIDLSTVPLGKRVDRHEWTIQGHLMEFPRLSLRHYATGYNSTNSCLLCAHENPFCIYIRAHIHTCVTLLPQMIPHTRGSPK